MWQSPWSHSAECDQGLCFDPSARGEFPNSPMDCLGRGREAPTGVIIMFYWLTNNKRNELVIQEAQALCRSGKEGVPLFGS